VTVLDLGSIYVFENLALDCRRQGAISKIDFWPGSLGRRGSTVLAQTCRYFTRTLLYLLLLSFTLLYLTFTFTFTLLYLTN
jgi:hypothetical protein